MSTRPTHKLTPSMEDVHRILNIFTSSPTEHIQRPLQRTKSTTQLCISPSYRKSITTSSSTIKKCTSPATTPHMPSHLFHIPVWPRSSHQHPPKPRRFTFAQRHIAKHDDNLIEPSPASFHGSWGRQPSVELHLPITARAFACDEIDDNMSTISLSPAALSPMSATIEALTNATTMLNVQSTITTTTTATVPAKPVEPARSLIQPATTTPTADTNTTPIAPARPLTPTTTTAAPIPVPIIPSPIIESDTPPLTPMKYITLPNSPPPSLPPNSPTPVIVHIPASPSSHTRVPPCTPINPIPLHHARTSHRLNRMSIKSSHDKSLPPFHSQSSTPLHYQSSHSSTYYQSHTPLHCLCASSPCSHIIDINTTHNYLYPSPTYSELSSFRSNIPSPNVSEHVTPTYTTPTPTHSRSSSRLIYTTPTHTRSSSRCNDTPTHAVYPSNWFNWRGRSMSMDACSPHHGTSVQSF